MSKIMTRIPSEFIAVCGFIVDIVSYLISDAVVNISQRRGAAMTSQGNARHEVGFCHSHTSGTVGVMGRSSTRG